MRDPKIDPMPGDVLKRRSMFREIKKLYGGFYEVEERDGFGHRRTLMPNRAQWCSWARTAEVISHGG